MRRLGLVVGLTGVVLASGVAAGSVLAGSSTSPGQGTRLISQRNEAPTQPEDGVHGGPIERFHGGAACDLVNTSELLGNWTHGDYVSAVEALGNAALVPEAARSDCGKPMVAVHHGGPPAHALEHKLVQVPGEPKELRPPMSGRPSGS